MDDHPELSPAVAAWSTMEMDAAREDAFEAEFKSIDSEQQRAAVISLDALCRTTAGTSSSSSSSSAPLFTPAREAGSLPPPSRPTINIANSSGGAREQKFERRVAQFDAPDRLLLDSAEALVDTVKQVCRQCSRR